MRRIILFAFIVHLVNCGSLVSVQQYPAVVNYDSTYVPVVPGRPALYSAPVVHTPVVHTPYVTVPPVAHHVAHNYQTHQTHPVVYQRPVYGVSPYYTHSHVQAQPMTRYIVPYISQKVVAPTSSIQQSHVVSPAHARVYQYRAYDNQNQQHYSPYGYSSNYVAYSNSPAANEKNQNKNYRNEQQYNSGVNTYSGNYAVEQHANGNSGNYAVQPNAGGSFKANNGQQKSAKVVRPAIQKEFFDIEERIIVRPAGKAIIELDPPASQPLKASSGNDFNYQSNFNNRNSDANANYNPNANYNANVKVNPNGNYNANVNFNSNYASANGGNHQGQYTSAQAHIVCPQDQQPGLYVDVGTPTPGAQGQYFTTTTTASTPVYINYQPSSTVSSSTQPQYSTTPTQFSSTSDNQFQSSSSTAGPSHFQSSTPGSGQQDVYVSSTTPVAVTIIENYDDKSKNNKNNQFNNTQDIIYAQNGRLTTPGHHANRNNNNNNNNNGTFYGNEQEDIDQIDDELPPRGDTSRSGNYQADDQFYHEAPRSRYTNGPYQPPVRDVETKYNGEPTERNEFAEEVTVGQYTDENSNKANSKYTAPDDKQQRLIELYTGNGGVSEVGKSHDAYTDSTSNNNNNNNNQYNANGNNEGRSGQYNQYNANGGQYNQYNGNNDNNQHNANGNNEGRSGQYNQYNANSGQYNQYNGNNDNSQYNGNGNNDGHNGQYRDLGNVRARVVAVTPAPENAVPSETVNTRRIVVSKYIQTVEEADDNATKGANGNGSGNVNDPQMNANANGNDNRSANNNNNNNSNNNNAASGYYVSTTPASTSQRIIYVQPVSQETAEKRAVTPQYRRA